MKIKLFNGLAMHSAQTRRLQYYDSVIIVAL